MSELLLDAAGRRRSPATLPAFHAGRPPRNKEIRYPDDPLTTEEIVAVLRRASDNGALAPATRRADRGDRSSRPSRSRRRASRTGAGESGAAPRRSRCGRSGSEPGSIAPRPPARAPTVSVYRNHRTDDAAVRLLAVNKIGELDRDAGLCVGDLNGAHGPSEHGSISHARPTSRSEDHLGLVGRFRWALGADTRAARTGS